MSTMNLPLERQRLITPQITAPIIAARKRSGQKITALTAYDAWMARLIDECDSVDIILVGDSLGMVVQGNENTLPVTIEQMIYHCACVTRKAKRALVVGDMPFMSYQVSPLEARANAGRLVQAGGVAAVKLEGGVAIAGTIAAIVEIGIPVMGHIGMTPQSVHHMGGFRVQGREDPARLIKDALAVAAAGAFAVVLEAIPGELAREITAAISIPTIGIGAGPQCDGQILVTHDILGLLDQRSPKFVRRYLEGADLFKQSINTYADEVRAGEFPNQDFSYSKVKHAS